jgi:hypothetical protein
MNIKMRLTSWTFLVSIVIFNSFITIFFSFFFSFFSFVFSFFFFHLPTELRISYLVQLHFHSWSMYKIGLYHFRFMLASLRFWQIIICKKKGYETFQKVYDTLEFQQILQKYFYILPSRSIFISWVLARMTFSPTLLVFSEIWTTNYFLTKNNNKNPHIYRVSHDQLWNCTPRLESDDTFHSLGGFSIRDHPKSLTSEATPSATQIFKRSYKMRHNPGL